MMYDFIPLAEIQKLLTFHPLKTYRLFSRMRQEGKLHEESGWITRDNQILINMPQFVAELQAAGYSNFIIDDIKRFQEISDDKQMKSDEIERNQMKSATDENMASLREDLKSDDFKRNQTISNDEQVISNEINSNQMKSDDQQTISNDFIKAKGAVIQVKDEMIKMLQQTLDRAEKRIEHLEGNNDQLTLQNNRLTQLTYLLMAPERKPHAEANDQPRHHEAYTMTPDNDEQSVTEEPHEAQEETTQAYAEYEETPPEHNNQPYSP
jgi:hypothetical protein